MEPSAPEELWALLFALQVLVWVLVSAVFIIVVVSLVDEPRILETARVWGMKAAVLARRWQIASRVKNLGLFALEIMRQLFCELVPFFQALYCAILLTMYVVLCLVDAFVKTGVAPWRWWARRSAHNSGVHHGESADDREATDEREPAEDLMLGEPETALREETANDRVATAAGLASDMRAATAADKSLGTASTIKPSPSSTASHLVPDGVTNGGRPQGPSGTNKSESAPVSKKVETASKTGRCYRKGRCLYSGGGDGGCVGPSAWVAKTLRPSPAAATPGANDASGGGGDGGDGGSSRARSSAPSPAAVSSGSGAIGGGDGVKRKKSRGPSPAVSARGGGGDGGSGGGSRARSSTPSPAAVRSGADAVSGGGGGGGKSRFKIGVGSGLRHRPRLAPRPEKKQVHWGDDEITQHGKRKCEPYPCGDIVKGMKEIWKDGLKRRRAESRRQRNAANENEADRKAAVPWSQARVCIELDHLEVRCTVWQASQKDKGGESLEPPPEPEKDPLPPIPRFNEEGEDRHAPVAQGEDVHVCTVRRSDEKEGWVEARLLDMDEGGREVPGAPVYLPVMILRDSGREAPTAEEETVYVRPGAGPQTWDWAYNDGRLIWEVPRSALSDKNRAEFGARCERCREGMWGCSWTPDRLELLCNTCAEKPREHAVAAFDHKMYGYGQFTWAHACECKSHV